MGRKREEFHTYTCDLCGKESRIWSEYYRHDKPSIVDVGGANKPVQAMKDSPIYVAVKQGWEIFVDTSQMICPVCASKGVVACVVPGCGKMVLRDKAHRVGQDLACSIPCRDRLFAQAGVHVNPVIGSELAEKLLDLVNKTA